MTVWGRLRARRIRSRRFATAALACALVAGTLATAAAAPAGADDGVATPVGTNVLASPVDATTGDSPVTVTFSEVTGEGQTSLTSSDTPSAPLRIDRWFGTSPVFYGLTTTASVIPGVTVCLAYDDSSLVDEAHAQLLGSNGYFWDVPDLGVSNDVDLNIACGTFSVLPVQVALASPDPSASPDVAQGHEVDPVDIDVLANDVDPAGHELSVGIWTFPQHGSVSVQPDRHILYQPQLYYCDDTQTADDQFQYSVYDTNFSISIASVTLDIPCIDGAPRAFDDDYSIEHDSGPFVFDPTTNDLDDAPDAPANLVYAIFAGPSFGQAQILDSGPGAHSIEYTPDPGFCGDDSVIFTVTDGSGLPENYNLPVARIHVACPNQPPVATDDDATVFGGGSVVVPVLGNDQDADSPPWALTVENVTTPSAGTAVALADGTIQYTPTSCPGVDTFDYDVVDDHGGRDTGTVNVTCSLDVTAPSLYRVEFFNGDFVDTDFGPQQLRVDSFWFDDESGFGNSSAPSVTFASPSGAEHVTATMSLGGYGLPGQYQFVGYLDLPEGSEKGTWRIETIDATDLGGNTTSMDAFDVQMAGARFSFVNGFPTAPPDDYDGVSAAIEDAGPNGGDANFDGVLDSWQPHVASFPNAVNGKYVTITAPFGTTLTNVAASTVPIVPAPPAGVSFPVGLLGYEVHGLAPGANAFVWIYFEGAPCFDRAYKLDDDTYTDATSITFGCSSPMYFDLTDGGAFDADGTADGVIVDPLLVGRTNSPPVTFLNPTTAKTAVPTPVNFSAFDPDFNPLTYTVGLAGHGTVTGTAPPFTYTSDAGYAGPDSFTVTISDGYSTTGPITVPIQVVPVPTITCTQTVANIPANGRLLLSFSPSCSSSDGSPVFGVINPLPVASHGTVSFSGYVPNAGFIGQDTIPVTVTTSNGGSALWTIVVNVIGATVTPATGDPGSPFTVSLFCKGLATVAVTKPGPVVLAQAAQSSIGDVTFNLTVPPVPAGTQLTVVARCDVAYGGYQGYAAVGGYSGGGYGGGYGGGSNITLPAAMFTVTGDGDGVEEAPGVDGNGDGHDDADQPNVTTIDAAEGGGSITIDVPSDGAADYGLSDVSTAPVPVDDPPPGEASFPAGLVNFTVDLPAGSPSGTVVDVKVYYPTGLVPTSVWKQGVNGAWTDFTPHVDFHPTFLVLHLVDGGQGDGDLVEDGHIEDPLALGVNLAPNATDDNASTDEDTAVVVSVLTNDDAGTGESSQTLHVASASDPPRGSTTVFDDGGVTKVRYTPDDDLHGSDSFTYQVCDDGTPEECTTATVNVTVNAVNDRPTISDTVDKTVKKNAKGVTFTVTVGDVDNSAASLVLQASSSDTSLVKVSDVTFSGTGATRTVSINPGNGKTGTATITLTVRDPSGATSSDSFVLTVAK